MHAAVTQIPRLHQALAAAALLLSTALIADAAQADAAQAQTKIVAGMVAHGPPQWPQYIAAEFGWLKDDKIELKFSAGLGDAQHQLG